MIALYSGTPGSGKSLHQAADIYDRLRFGGLTVTNYPVNIAAMGKRCRGAIIQLDNSELTPRRLQQIANVYWHGRKPHESAISVYIDEAQILFNSRDAWRTNERQGWVKFFTEHRKYGFDIFLVAQYDRMLDRQIRSLIEYEYIHRKVTSYGWRGALIAPITGQFLAVQVWYPMGLTIGSKPVRKSKKYTALYDTYKVF